MNLNIRQSATQIAATDLSRVTTVADHTRAWQAPVIWPPPSGRLDLQAKTPLDGSSYAEQLKMWRQDQFEEDLVFVAVGLSGIAGVVTALVAAL